MKQVRLSNSISEPAGYWRLIVARPIVACPIVARPIVARPIVTRPFVTRPFVTRPFVTFRSAKVALLLRSIRRLSIGH